MKQLKKILIITLFPLICFATAQIPDKIIIEKDTLILYSNPLEQYLNNKSQRTLNNKPIEATSTACYRGYQAIWKIEDNCLFLVDARIDYHCDTSCSINLKDEFGFNSVIADWFTGEIIVPFGKKLIYIHDSYMSIYENELELIIDNGELIGQSIYNNSISDISIFTMNIDSLNEFIYNNLEWAKIPHLGSKNYKITIEVKSSESNEHVNEIRILNKWWFNKCDKEIMRVLKMLSKKDVF